MKKQRGATLIGMVIIAALAVFVVVIVAKLTPTYIEYWSVNKIMSAMAQDPALQDMSSREIRNSFNRRADIDSVTSISGDDLDISREDGKVAVSVDYSTKVHLFGNVNACMDFSSSSAK